MSRCKKHHAGGHVDDEKAPCVSLSIDADSHPDPALIAEVAERIESGRVLGGGVTIRVDTKQWTARIVTIGRR